MREIHAYYPEGSDYSERIEIDPPLYPGDEFRIINHRDGTSQRGQIHVARSTLTSTAVYYPPAWNAVPLWPAKRN